MTTVARAASTDVKRFQIGGVIAASVRLYGRNIAVLTLLLVALYWLPVMVFNQAAPWLLHRFAPPSDYTGSLGVARAIINALIAQTLAVCVASLVLGPAIPFREASVRAFGQTAELVPRIVLISLILHADQVVRAIVFFSTPTASVSTRLTETGLWSFGLLSFTIFTTLAFGISAPVLAVERPSVLATLGRAFRLMSGHRWSFFGLLMISGIAFALVAATEQAVLGSALRTNPIVQAANLFIVGQLAIAWAVIVAASYRELVRIKEGWRAPDVADVFD